MNRLISFLVLLLMFSPVVHAKNPNELSAIKDTAMNYMQSWYQGDVKRMEESLHKKLAKRSIRFVSPNKKELGFTTASNMIWYTRDGYGKNLWRKDLKIEVIVLDYYKNIASVKVITPHYYEYLHIAKIDKKWVIVNALYETNSPTRD